MCVAALSASLLAADLSNVVRADAANPCEGIENEIRLDATEHVLRLCERGIVAAAYPVSLGRGGLGKEREGDRKTPLGRYSLSTGRPSKSFGLFVLIGYPNAQQRTLGFTGGGVGIHGPTRSMAARASQGNAPVHVRSDWTDGCIALDTDAEIGAIATWINRSKARWIEIY